MSFLPHVPVVRAGPSVWYLGLLNDIKFNSRHAPPDRKMGLAVFFWRIDD